MPPAPKTTKTAGQSGGRSPCRRRRPIVVPAGISKDAVRRKPPGGQGARHGHPPAGPARNPGTEADVDNSRIVASLMFHLDHERLRLDSGTLVIFDAAGMTDDPDMQ